MPGIKVVEHKDLWCSTKVLCGHAILQSVNIDTKQELPKLILVLYVETQNELLPCATKSVKACHEEVSFHHRGIFNKHVFVKLKAPGESFQTDFHLQKGWLSQIGKTAMCRPKVKYEFLLNYMKMLYFGAEFSRPSSQLYSWFMINSVTCSLDLKIANSEIMIRKHETMTYQLHEIKFCIQTSSDYVW